MNQTLPSSSRGHRALPFVLAAALTVGVGAAANGTGTTAADGIARLKAGNARFVANPAEHLAIDADGRAALASGQSPFATVVSCADSRVPPEVIFHAGLGELFVVRAAGHVADHSVLASIEYAAEHLDVPVIVVMGHEMCGAVKAAIETPAGTSLGTNLDYLVKAIRPAVARTTGQPAETRLRAAILENVEETINDLVTKSTVLRHLAESGRVTLVGAYYELATGRAHFSEPVHVPAALPSVTH
jgi:carbonic anhydrase